MKNILLAAGLLLAVPAGFAQSQKLDWAIRQGGPQEEVSYGVTTDQKGNVYTAGYFSGTVDFDPGPGSYPLTAAGSGEQTYISKVDASGKLLWAKLIQSTGGYCRATGIKSDTANNLYVCGYYTGDVDIDPGPGVKLLTSGGWPCLFTVKYDSSGALKWAVRGVGGSANSIAVDREGNSFVAGVFGNTLSFYSSTGIKDMEVNSFSTYDMFLLSLDKDGMVVYAMSSEASTGGNAYASSVSVDTLGNVFCTGRFQGSIIFPFMLSPSYLTSNSGSDDIFLLKTDYYTHTKWVQQIGSVNKDVGLAVAADNSGAVIASGAWAGPADFDPGPGTTTLSTTTPAGYICRFDNDGNLKWAKGFTGTSGSSLCNTLTVQHDGTLYAGGAFAGTVDLDPGAGVQEETAYGSVQDIYIARMDTAGAFNRAKTIPGLNTVVLNALHHDAAGNLYATGYFNSTTDFNPGPGKAPLTPAGNFDNYTMKLSPCTPATVTTSLTACGSYTFGDMTFTNSGIYDLVAGGSSGCDSFITLNLSIAPGIDTVTSSGSTLSAKTSGATYQWFRCPGYTIIPGATSQNFTATTTGAYAVVVSNGTCTDTSYCVAVTGTGLADPLANELIKIYPNPAGKVVSVVLPYAATGVQLQISSISGQVVLQQDQLSGAAFSMDLSGLAPGMYFLKISEQDKVIGLRKLVRE
jgi:hypothetical protein